MATNTAAAPTPYRFTRDEYYRMAEARLFQDKRYDHTRKAYSYAGARIPEYWIVNLVDRQVEVLTDPDASSRNYRQQRVVMPHEELTLPGGSSLTVSSILP